MLFLISFLTSGCKKLPTGFSDPTKITQENVSIKPKKGSRFSIAKRDDLIKNKADGLLWYSTKFGGGFGKYLEDGEAKSLSKFQKNLRQTVLNTFFELAKDNGAQAVRVSAKNSNGKRIKFEAWLLINQVAKEAKEPAASSYELTLPPEYVDAVEKGSPIIYLEKIQYPHKIVGNAWILFSGF